jgi:hypothetical protein
MPGLKGNSIFLRLNFIDELRTNLIRIKHIWTILKINTKS